MIKDLFTGYNPAADCYLQPDELYTLNPESPAIPPDDEIEELLNQWERDQKEVD